MADRETYQSIVDILRKHSLRRRRDPEQSLGSLTLGEQDAASRYVAESKESTNLPQRQSHPSGTVDTSLGAEPRLSDEGRFVCGICGARFRGSICGNGHEKRHEEGRPHRCPEPGCNKTFKSKGSVRKHAKLVRCFNSPTWIF